tara:strand:+ start:582 stop:1511 length:930 start_codon:yes stop_codon:yes gene_type:complete
LKLNRNGILLLDKPKGISSNRALSLVKKIFCPKKAGHAGTLDPLATGILPILFGEATKFAEYGLNSNKRYLAEISLGTKTTTGDSEGEIIEKISFTENVDIKSVLKSFIGEQFQMPPMFSALKYNGIPLYKYAREGQEIARNSRLINIKSIKFISLNNKVLKIDVVCSKGTYIRTLAEDIGKRLGSCAHLSALRRIGIGALEIGQTITIDKLAQLADSSSSFLNDALKPIELFINHWPSVQLVKSNENNFLNGQLIKMFCPSIQDKEECLVRVYGFSNNFLGTGQIIDNKQLRPVRLISKTNFINAYYE